jgi:hypothetical protein
VLIKASVDNSRLPSDGDRQTWKGWARPPKFDRLRRLARLSLPLRTTLRDFKDLSNSNYFVEFRKFSFTKVSKKRSGDHVENSRPESSRVVVGSDGSFECSMNPLSLALKIARLVLVILPESFSKYMICKAFLLLEKIIPARSASPLPMLCRQQSCHYFFCTYRAVTLLLNLLPRGQ